jgi:hypothetical protein
LSDIREWLNKIGFGQYADAFEGNAIGMEHLPDLDADALKEPGVAAMDHRLTLLKAAAGKVQNETTAPPAQGR